VNECADGEVCGQGHCVNVPGSFECLCAAGYRVGRDGRCEGLVPPSCVSLATTAMKRN